MHSVQPTEGLNSSEWTMDRNTDCLLLPVNHWYPSKIVSKIMVRELQTEFPQYFRTLSMTPYA